MCPAIQERVERYSASEIRFNLMAVIKRRSDILAEQLAAAEAREKELAEGSMEVDGQPGEALVEARAEVERCSTFVHTDPFASFVSVPRTAGGWGGGGFALGCFGTNACLVLLQHNHLRFEHTLLKSSEKMHAERGIGCAGSM